MALDKNYKDYSYNLGRTVAVVEIMNGLPKTFRSDVFDNAMQKLPYQLNQALLKHKHNLFGELVEPAGVILNNWKLPSKVLSAIDPTGRFWTGYYHEKSYLADTYKGIYGTEETTVEHHTPERIEVTGGDNAIDELKR